MEVPPSPNNQTQAVGEFADSSTKRTLNGRVPLVVFEINATEGIVAAQAGAARRRQRSMPYPAQEISFILHLLRTGRRLQKKFWICCI